MKVKVSLDTIAQVNKFVGITSQIDAPIYLVSDGFKVSAKSLLGALYTMEWSEVWCECDEDIYSQIAQFVI